MRRLAIALIIAASLAPAAQAANPPRFTPKAPDGLGEFAATPQLKPIHFAFDRADVRASDAAVLDAAATWLKANPTYAILAAGYADPRGTKEYNLALGERRAAALRDQLVARGVRADRIALGTYGEGVPSCRAQTEACWAENRQARILVREAALQVP